MAKALPLLDEDFRNPKTLFLIGFILMKTEKYGLAYWVLKAGTDIFPGEPALWHNMGKCCYEKQLLEDAEENFRRALRVDPKYAASLDGLGLISLNKSEFGMAIDYCSRALAIDPSMSDSRVNLGMCYLSMGRWAEGWPCYNVNIGTNSDRKELKYSGEPRWDGSKGKDVVVIGEQGIGDEISFGTCIPDLIRDSKSVTIECDGRLTGAFSRAFPSAEVHGTRYKKDKRTWTEGRKFDAHVMIGQLPHFYRQKNEDFPGTPYLVPDPERVVQWRALLDSLGPRPKIGIAWTGGRPWTGRQRRSVTLDTLAPLLKFDADWISLQYQDADDIKPFEEKTGVKIHHWDWGTQAYDYDQTIALISQLDLVISVTTTVIHAAGALGKETWCLVPRNVMWRYLDKGEWFPWAKSVTLYRQKGREWPIHILLGKLKDKFQK